MPCLRCKRGRHYLIGCNRRFGGHHHPRRLRHYLYRHPFVRRSSESSANGARGGGFRSAFRRRRNIAGAHVPLRVHERRRSGRLERQLYLGYRPCPAPGLLERGRILLSLLPRSARIRRGHPYSARQERCAHLRRRLLLVLGLWHPAAGAVRSTGHVVRDLATKTRLPTRFPSTQAPG